tara:strand:- start:2601 stop:3461 length:861 start_codon:yes stop_codon:yes gene_type:complete
MVTDPNTSPLRSLLGWINARSDLADNEARQELGDAFEWAEARSVLVPRGSFARILCPACSGHAVRLELHNGNHVVRCTETGIQLVSASAFDRWRVDVGSFAKDISAAMALPETSFRTRREGHLFELGSLDHDGRDKAVFLLAGGWDTEILETSLNALDNLSSRDTGLVLTTAKFPLSLRSDAKHRFIPLEEIMALEEDGLKIDRLSLGKWLRAGHRPRPKRTDAPEWHEIVDRAVSSLKAAPSWGTVQTSNARAIRSWAKDRKIDHKLPKSDRSIVRHFKALNPID